MLFRNVGVRIFNVVRLNKQISFQIKFLLFMYLKKYCYDISFTSKRRKMNNKLDYIEKTPGVGAYDLEKSTKAILKSP